MSRAPSPSCKIADFVRGIETIDAPKSVAERFRDFCELGFCAIAKTTAASPERAEALEEHYMRIVASYPDKSAIRAYPALLALASSGVRDGDFLGSVATRLDTLDARTGQFFTPYAVSRMIAAMSMQDVDALIASNGFITVREPASGAGGMVLAAADEVMRRGFDPALHMLVHATDVSTLCFHMSYLQLALRGVPAWVAHGDTLSLETFSGAWTPATLPFFAHHGRLFPEPPPAGENDPAPELPAGGQLRLF